MQIERIVGGPTHRRALGTPRGEHVAHNRKLLGDAMLRGGPGVVAGRVPEEPCREFLAYYNENHTDGGLQVGPVRRGGFGMLYPETHDAPNYEKQKRLTVVQRNSSRGADLRVWCENVPGFEAVETAARNIGQSAFSEPGYGLYPTAWHIIEQPFGAGDATSFGAHTDDEEEPTAVVTVVVKLTEGWSRMAVEGAVQSFAYAWAAGSAAAFDARCWHRSIPTRASDPTALKVAFFYTSRRPPAK